MARSVNLAPFAMIFLAGSLVMLWFVILSGLTQTSPLRQTYFLRADTSGIEGARAISQWTYFKVCGDGNTDCGPARPALPLGDAWDTDADGVPSELIGDHGDGTTSHYFWYMWRFGWVFYLISLFFATAAFFTGFLACISRLGAALAGLVSLVALVFMTVAVSLMTATFVEMRNVFVANGRDASLGQYGFGFSWGSWAALLISTILFCMARRKPRDSDGVSSGRRWGSRWGRRRSSATAIGSRRSYDGRRVKEEYP
ncbi:Protein SUR7 [Madurella mycetomatis]|uniref:Protein SUR7 n=1 Tax=Madurella mycetomatis TaxID=100816 RepID=A0A175W7D4_9PEZI|nr:Protein SUR7 [Madurella mycetomatis]